MSFSSLVFIFYFLPAFITAYALVPQKYSSIVLILFSFLFYFWGAHFLLLVLLLVFIILANYACGLLIGLSAGTVRKLFFWAGLLGNLSILFLFKYLSLAVHTIEGLLGMSISLPYLGDRELPLPLGISFIIFKVMSYLIDVHRGSTPAEKNLVKMSAYVSMFPTLVAGPIVRYGRMADDLGDREFSRDDLVKGIKLFIIGLSFKVLLSDQLAVYVDTVFAQVPGSLSPFVAWFGAMCYTLQIYFDFGGYSLMAIGLGRMLGFTIPENFNLPYLSPSVTEFWRRWHMTLTSWLRDYLYIPLGGNRGGRLSTYRNLFIVFLLCGVWHGANYTFFAWGIYHGLFLIVERVFKENRIELPVPGFVKHAYLIVVVTVGWVLFRSENLSYAMQYIAVMFGVGKGVTSFVSVSMINLTPLSVLLILLCVGFSCINEKDILSLDMKAKHSSQMLKAGLYALFLAISTVFLIINTHNPFIYQQF